MDIAMVGPAIVLGLSAIGASIGCCIAGMASHAAMMRSDESHGKFIILSAAPSTQIMYGFLLMILMKQYLLSGHLSPLSGIAIGLMSGLGVLFAAIYQGKVAATGIQAVAKQPALFGKCLAAVGIIESLALFVAVFPLMIM